MKIPHLSALLLLCLFVSTAFITQAEAAAGPEVRVALLIDQPIGKVLEMEPSIVAEIAQRMVRNAAPTEDAFSLTLIFPTDDGQLADEHGKPVDLRTFQTLWIHQCGTNPWSDGILGQLRAFCETENARPTLLLTGDSVEVLKALQWAEVTAEAPSAKDDRFSMGLIPNIAATKTAERLWKNLQADRGVFWFTNAVFNAFEKCQVQSPSTTTVAGMPEGGSGYAMTLTVHGNAVLFSLPWRFSNLYDRADELFRENTEAFLTTLCTWKNTPEALEELQQPADPAQGVRRVLNDGSTVGSNRLAPWRPEIDTEPLLRLLDASPEYPRAVEFRQRLAEFIDGRNTDTAAFQTLKREILLANPALDFSKILFIQRKAGADGLPTNWTSNSSIAKSGYSNTIRTLDFRSGKITTVYTPPGDFFAGDLELHFEADKLLFSMPSSESAEQPWRLWEIPLDTTQMNAAEQDSPVPAADPSQNPQATLLPTIEQNDVDNYDACYLPDGGVIFCSTACFTGVPCINGSGHVCNLYKRAADGTVRQLTLEQDHDWCPTLLPNGRVMYLRWEYSDIPHAFSRILFHANPDGTNQSEYYGSGSYYPSTMFYARPLPGSGSSFAAICGGHHELPRCGDLVLFDPSKGRRETEGAIQRIPGFGKKVPRVMLDTPIAQSWPKFLHPYPISETTFLVSAKMNESTPWRIWLVDIYDNMLELGGSGDAGFSQFEPIPWKPVERPPVLMDRTDETRSDADVFMADVYYGQGLPGVPRGTVKALRLITYEFSYQGMGAEPHSVGLDGPWDPKRILGTVPVYEDGSAHFRIPANTPVAFQPLDSEGRAIQLMRSWVTAMPGESVSCTGCHEEQNSVPPPMPISTAAKREPDAIQPFYGPTRGFSFRQEVQPVLDRYCADCHEERQAISFRDGPVTPATSNPDYYNVNSRFSPSYYRLRRYVRTQTKESQMEVHKPYEFHADATHLMQLLKHGHYGAETQLDSESWAKLYTWIDLNAPFYGSWGESRNYAIAPTVLHQYQRRLALRKLYTTQTDLFAEDPSGIPAENQPPVPPEQRVYPHEEHVVPLVPPVKGTPPETLETQTLDLGEGVRLMLVHVPSAGGWFGQFEVTNEQFAQFDPSHDTGIEYSDFIQFSPNEQGWSLARAQQPVARISHAEAVAFCEWLSQKTGHKCTLPTAEQWRLAAAGGTETPFWFGAANADYGDCENLADSTLQQINPLSWPGRVDALPPWRIADTNVNDRSRVAAPVGSYAPNPFGLYDMHGNVAEWTSTQNGNRPMACGGSWYTPARWSTRDAFRVFDAGQEVFDVGFRVFVPE